MPTVLHTFEPPDAHGDYSWVEPPFHAVQVADVDERQGAGSGRIAFAVHDAKGHHIAGLFAELRYAEVWAQTLTMLYAAGVQAGKREAAARATKPVKTLAIAE